MGNSRVGGLWKLRILLAVCPRQLTRDSGAGRHWGQPVIQKLTHQLPAFGRRTTHGYFLLQSSPAPCPPPHVRPKVVLHPGSFSWHYPGFSSLFDVGHRTIVLKDNEKGEWKIFDWVPSSTCCFIFASEEVELAPWLSLHLLILPPFVL